MPEQSDWPPEVRAEMFSARLHILDGSISAFHQRDEISHMVWNCESPQEALARLVAEPFRYSETQAHHILDQTLRRQTKEHLRTLESERASLLRKS